MILYKQAHHGLIDTKKALTINLIIFGDKGYPRQTSRRLIRNSLGGLIVDASDTDYNSSLIAIGSIGLASIRWRI